MALAGQLVVVQSRRGQRDRVAPDCAPQAVQMLETIIALAALACLLWFGANWIKENPQDQDEWNDHQW
jgi:hypothetical protein